MKKLVLAAVLGLGILCVANLNAQNLAKNQTPQNAKNQATQNAQNLSGEQFNQLFNDCLENKQKTLAKAL